jgi:hypothetical protein
MKPGIETVVVDHPDGGDYVVKLRVPFYTADQLREAQVKVLREAADRLCGVHRDEIRSMADEIERSKT